MLLCKHCGIENRDSARFCRSCGLALHAAPGVGPGPAAGNHRAELPVSQVGITPPASETARSQGKALPQETAPVSDLAAGDTASAAANISATADRSAIADSPATAPVSETPAEPRQPVLQGGRFHIVRQVASAEAGAVYEAEDARRCAACGKLQDSPGLLYCQGCGKELAHPPLVRLKLLNEHPPAGIECEWFVEAGSVYQVEAFTPPNNQPDQPGAVRLACGYGSNTGHIRESNEDSLLALQLAGISERGGIPTLSMFAVADGIGGHAGGEVASQMAVQSLAGSLMQRVFIPTAGGQAFETQDLETELRAAVLAANQAILEARSQENPDSRMGCTLTTALVYGPAAWIANVGDSRAYLLHFGHLTQLTRDHSVAVLLAEQGLILPDEVHVHHQKQTIYRSLGDHSDLLVDTYTLDLVPGDRLLLCSDGLWEMLSDSQIEDILLESPDPQAACSLLVDRANLHGGVDNISVVVVHLEAPAK